MKDFKSITPNHKLLSCPINTLSFEEQVLLIIKWARHRESRMVCLANVHMLMEAYWSEKFKSILENADLVTSDGMPLVWLLRALGTFHQERVAGVDLFLRLCQLATVCKVPIFLLGSEIETLKKIKQKLYNQYPGIKVVGMESPPFRTLSTSENNALVKKINQTNPGIVFVCLGCPKQEYWMAENRHKISSVLIGVGAVFAVYAEIKKWAPKYIREWGLEWLYRLIQEPLRLWPRYSKTIPPFLYLALKELLHRKGHYDLPLIYQSDFLNRNQFDRLNILSLLNPDLKPSRIGEILTKNNLIDSRTLTLCLKMQQKCGQKLGDILVSTGKISRAEINYYLRNQKATLKSLISEKKLVDFAKFNKLKIANFMEDIEEHELAKFLLKNKFISLEQLEAIIIEKNLRITGCWLNNYPPLISLQDQNQSSKVSWKPAIHELETHNISITADLLPT